MYKLGGASRRELAGVHPRLVSVVELAIKITEQDFSVVDGLRTIAEQEEYVRRGTSHTMKSKHLPQPDGYGHATDLIPYINGKARWELGACYPIAEAVRAAARQLQVRVVWGGHWGLLNQDDRPPEEMVEHYAAVRRAAGKKAFIDGPHYQLG